MYKNKKIILFAFASQDLSRSANRLKKQALSSNYYDEIKILSPKSLFYKNLDILIIFAWNYSDVIIKNINKNKLFRKRSFKFLIPFPKPKIIK